MAEEIPAEYKDLISTLQKMKIAPKADNPEAFQQWIQEFAKQQAQHEPEDKKPEPAILTTTHAPLRLNNFSGHTTEKKSGETSYELWKFEIQGLVKDKIHSEGTILQAIRKSARGEAGLVLMRLGPEASLPEVMTKMESVFGNVDEMETIMSDFYNARQKEDEDVSAWSCRLESILDKAIQSGKVPSQQADKMLHDMLWKGLQPQLKDVSHYEKVRYDTFDRLRVGLRRLEREHQLDKPLKVKATSKQAIAEKDENTDVTGILKQINSRLENLESNQINKSQQQDYRRLQPRHQPQQYQGHSQFRGRDQGRGGRYMYRGSSRGYGRGNTYGQYRQAPSTNTYGQYQRAPSTNTYGQYQRAPSTNTYGQYQQSPSNTYGQYHQAPSTNTYPPLVCNRCGRDFHIAKGCRANTDVNGKPLN